MSGRGRGGRGQGRNGSGRGHYRRRNRDSDPKKNGNTTGEKKKVFEPYYAGKHQADTYDSVKEHIILQVQRTFTDSERIVKVLREEDHNAG